MIEEHNDQLDSSLEGILGRLIGQDILLRRILIQMAVNQAVQYGPEALNEQRRMLEEWLEESRQIIAQIRIDHPNENSMKESALASIKVNLGDVIQALAEAAKSKH